MKNQGDLLPLDRNIKSIAVIGPNSNFAELGDYCFADNKDTVNPLEGIRAAVSKKTQVSYAEGCGIHQLSKDGFKEAIEVAKKSEVAIVVVGEASLSSSGIGWIVDGIDTRPPTCGESFDRADDLNLPGVQQELVEAVVGTGTPTAVVLISGRANSIYWIVENVPAIIQAWYPGEEGGMLLLMLSLAKSTHPESCLFQYRK